MEVMYTLAAYSWTLPDHLANILLESQRGWQSTLIVENAFRICRRKESHASGRSSVLAAWHAVAVAPDLLPEYDRPHLESVPGGGGDAKLTDAFCEQTSYETGFEAAELDQILSSSPGFPTLSVSAGRESVVRSMALLKSQGDWQLLQRAWLSQLVTAGWLLHNSRSPGQGWFVIRATNHGILALRCRLQKRGGLPVLSGMFARSEDLDYVLLTSLEEWQALPTKCLHPRDGLWQAGAGVHGLCIVAAPGVRARPLLELALLGGCANLTLHQLRRLATEVCAQGASSSGSSSSSRTAVPTATEIEAMSVEECLGALARTVFKEVTDEEVRNMATRRDTRDSDAVVGACVVDNGHDLIYDSESEAEVPDAAAVELVTRELVTAKARLNKYPQSERAVAAKARERRAHTLPALRSLPFRSESPLGFQEAKDFFPPGAVPSLELVRFKRWRCTAPYMGRHVSKVFGGRAGLSQDDSLRFVLAAAWQPTQPLAAKLVLLVSTSPCRCSKTAKQRDIRTFAQRYM